MSEALHLRAPSDFGGLTTFVTWRAEERMPGYWWVVETYPNSMYPETHYGPMWEEMVEPLIDELREITRCIVANISKSDIYGPHELQLPIDDKRPRKET